ncbi:MAG TPA: translesion DNA synthesis-associated protein ImuA [Woeseiaceae bacterium]|nr:translesion DNA synthesis-associated protein ImuA [Woeseiaceae bacterium]
MNDALEQLLQNPRVWRGQSDASARQGLATGYPRLDQHLPGGGWPPHALTEILLERYGSGELKLLMPALARLSQAAGKPRDDAADAGWLAWIAPPFQPYPPALMQWGIDLSRVLIVRPRQGSDALWAAEQALSSGNCAAVLLWSEAFDHAASRRLQLAAEQGASWAIAFRPPGARREHSAAALRLELANGRTGTDIFILKSRGGRPAAVHGVIHDYASLPGS